MTFEVRHPQFLEVADGRWEYTRNGQLVGVIERWNESRGGGRFHQAIVYYRGAWWDAGSHPDVTEAVMKIVAITNSPDEAEWVLSPGSLQLAWKSWEGIAARQVKRRRKA